MNYIYESSLFSFPILSLGIRCLPRGARRNSSGLETEPRPFEKRPISITKGPIAGDGWLSAVKYRRRAARTRQPLFRPDCLLLRRTGMEIHVKWATYNSDKQDWLSLFWPLPHHIANEITKRCVSPAPWKNGNARH